MDAEPFAAGTRVERHSSPADTLIKDGLQGVVVGDPLQAANGELGYFVRFEPSAPPIFCAGSRLKRAD